MKAARRRGLGVVLQAVCLIAVSRSADAQHEPVAMPFEETFASPTLSPAWKTNLAKGNTIEVKDGALVIRARTHTRANIERPVNADLIRVSCAIRPESGVTNASLCLRWDRENACQIGVAAREASRIHVREVLGTYAYDYDLGPWPAGRWEIVGIEVGKDCIRYLAGDDARRLKTVRVSRRPGRLSAAPAALILGEDPEVKVFPRANPFIDPPASETFGVSCVRNVGVTPIEPNHTDASPDELAAMRNDERDLLGEQELASSDDPTFESVCRHFPAMKWPREVVGVKDHPHAIGVAHDGSLQFTDDSARFKEPRIFFEIGEPPYRFGTGPTSCRRRLHNGYRPIVILADRHDGLELEQTVFGHTKDLSPDASLFAYVRFRVTNSGAAARNIKLQMCIHPASDKSPMRSWQLDVPAHGDNVVHLRAPFAVLKSPVVEVTADEFDARLTEVTAYWDKLLAQGTRFEIPEQRVQDAYRAWLACNFINVHKRNGVYHVCDGSGFYTQVYGYSVALNCIAMDTLGYHDLAARNMDSLLTFMQPNGLLAVNFGDTDTGAALYAMSEHYRITRDADWLRRVAPKMISMCNWIIEQRKAALAYAATQPAVTKGLIRYRPYADLLTPAADYFSNGYLCRGLAATADVFAEIGMNDEAVRLKKASEEYVQDIRTSMDAAVFTDGGMTILPAIPDTRELWKESNGSANGYYGLIAMCMLEAGIPAWNDPKADLLISALRGRGGLMLGVCQFHHLIDHAYTYAYWMACLKRDEVKPAILGLYSSVAYGMTRDTYSAVECTAIRTGENYWTLPHTYSNTQQLRLLRNLLLREDGADLWVAQAIPRPWLADGKRVAVKAAPTAFGSTSFVIESRVNTGAIDVHIDPPSRGVKGTVRVRLREPDRRRIKTVECQPQVLVEFKGEDIELPRLARPVDLQVKY